jgi:hypothetical protein
MTVELKIALRLQFLARVVRKECKHLTTTDQRLFGGLCTLEQATRLEQAPDLAERVEAFVGRFFRRLCRYEQGRQTSCAGLRAGIKPWIR